MKGRLVLAMAAVGSLAVAGCSSSSSVPYGLAAADYIGDLDMGFGRLDTYQAVLACQVLP